jgi:8-oxo-dGTP pyrophosphatase MutT (NUDIX family)
MKNKDIHTGAAKEQVIIVDKKNRPVGIIPRYRMRSEGLIHRATYILILDNAGHVFIQKRTQTKDFLPGYYDAAAGGVVIAGEDYETSAYRELHEELGISSPLNKLFDFYFEAGNQKMWGRAYSCIHEGPFILQAEEIESGAFYPIDDVLSGKISPITPDTFYVLRRFIKSARSGVEK